MYKKNKTKVARLTFFFSVCTFRHLLDTTRRNGVEGVLSSARDRDCAKLRHKPVINSCAENKSAYRTAIFEHRYFSSRFNFFFVTYTPFFLYFL